VRETSIRDAAMMSVRPEIQDTDSEWHGKVKNTAPDKRERRRDVDFASWMVSKSVRDSLNTRNAFVP
jgi:hypothetical protein